MSFDVRDRSVSLKEFMRLRLASEIYFMKRAKFNPQWFTDGFVQEWSILV